MDFGIEDTSYRRSGMFAQCPYHFLAIGGIDTSAGKTGCLSPLLDGADGQYAG
jgi:hypothetical protein